MRIQPTPIDPHHQGRILHCASLGEKGSLCNQRMC